MKRREFIVGAGAAALMVPGSASAALRCTNADWRGIQQCEAGIPSLRIIPALQRCPQWCWAACIQMIFAKHRHRVSQEDIVAGLFGDLRCSPANGPQIARAVNSRRWRDSRGRRFYPKAFPLADFDFGVNNFSAAAQAARYLADGYPLINGAVGHATVMTSMTYLRAPNGQGEVQSIIVRDPWPGAGGRRMLTAREAYGTRLLLAIEV
ncbi:MAG: papain-like cysteine protease family protein [Pseudomonadota bacterium]